MADFEQDNNVPSAPPQPIRGGFQQVGDTIYANNKTIEARYFLVALVGDYEELDFIGDCKYVLLDRCKIEGVVDISKAGVEPNENGRYLIGKKLDCKSCVFTEGVDLRRTDVR